MTKLWVADRGLKHASGTCMLKTRFVLLFSILLAFNTVWASAPKSSGLFLAFEQRLAVSYALLAQGLPSAQQEEVFERAQKYFTQMVKNPVSVEVVANFPEFLKKFKGEWPNTHSLELDLQTIEQRAVAIPTLYVSNSPRIQRQITEYLKWQNTQLFELAQQGDANKTFSETTASLISAATLPDAKNILISMSDALIKEEMKKLDHIGEAIAGSSLAQQQDAGIQTAMQTIFSEYFARLSPATKKLIISSYLGGDLQANDLKKFEVMIQNSGPQLQKLLQVVARQSGIAPEMIEIFKTLENSVRPVPWSEVEKILSHEKENFIFTYFEKKAVGVGTMAQVHRAKILLNNERQDVVVRFIKPGIAERVEEDRRVLTEVAKILDANPIYRKSGAPQMAPLVDDITATVTAELDQKATVDRQKLAKLQYEKEVFIKAGDYKNALEFHVPAIYTSKNKSELMVQELVIGNKLDKEVAAYGKKAAAIKLALVEEVAKLWAREVMFGGGFYHSDLHQGNFMVKISDAKIVLNILDFGMGGVMSESLRNKVMMLFAGVQLNKPEIIAKAFWGISEQSRNTVRETQLFTLVANKSARIAKKLEKPLAFEEWTAWALDKGLRLPYDFIGLNRGMVIVDKLLEESKSTKTVKDYMKSFAKVEAISVFRRLVVKEGLSNLDLVKLGWSELTSKPLPELKTAAPLMCERVFAN
jgi:ubiquinone biosynthesis protein